MSAEQRVESERFPYLPLRLDVGDQVLDIEALLDTGFDGDVAIPPELIAEGLAPDGFAVYGLADESRVRAPLYRGTVRVGDLAPFPVDLTALGDEPIVGRGVSDRYTIILDHGRRVIVEA